MRAWAALVLVGCASGQAVTTPADGEITPIADAAVDGGETPVDAKVTPVDAKPIDAKPIDAPPVQVPPDAYQCMVKTRQLLINPVLDLNPSGMGWIQQNIDNAYPIITDQDGVAEHSPPFKAWLGGFTGQEKGVTSVTDTLYQDITVPAGTTQLVLTGQYEVRTSETATTAFDTAQLAIVQTNGTPIETVKAVSNITPTTAWTAINHTVAANLSGQTVRLRITSTNDIIDVTSFYFDTLALTATYCQ